MKKKILLLAASLFATTANAQTFEDALGMAYQNSPALKAEQARLRAIDSSVSEAQSGWRPTAVIDATAGITNTDTAAGDQTLHPRSVTAQVQQPIYRGGRTVATTNIAKADVMAGRANLLAAEQNVLLAAATAYLDVLRDETVLDLNKKNESVLSEQLNASQSRFDVGTITKTDVSQSQSRLSRASADRIQAEGLLNVSRAQFARYVGQQPESLQTPEFDLKVLPKTLEEAIAQAEKENPLVVAATYNEKGASASIDNARGGLYPEVNVIADATRGYDQSTVYDGRTAQTRLLGQLTIPLYTAGADYARLKAAKETSTQRKLEVDEARRIAREQAVSAWESLQAARASVEAREAQRTAAELALEGVRKESDVGTRTTLDILDAEQELLDARASHVTAQRDVKVASLQLLSAIGQMTAESLALKTPYYDPAENYRKVDGAWFGG